MKVLLAAGLGTQLYKLNLLMDSNEVIKSKDPPDLDDETENTENKVESIASDDDPRPESASQRIDGEAPKEWIKYNISIPEARNLPLITSKSQRDTPVTYVSISNGLRTFSSDVVHRSCHPQWLFRAEIPLSDQLLVDSRRQVIVKVWHRDDNESDYVIGFAAIDLGILLHDGFMEISGWYNIMDFVGRCRGQVKVEIKPHMDPVVLKQKYAKPNLKIEKPVVVVRTSGEKSVSIKETAWKAPTLELDADATRSVLEQKLSELDIMSRQWKSRLSDDHTEPDDRETLERLRSNLALQFQTMHTALFSGAQNDVSNQDDDDFRPRMAPDGGNPLESDKD